MAALVKICGITNLEDALVAVQAGADALGFIFFPKSPRFVPARTAAEITARLPASLLKVGVFVDEPIESARRIMAEAGLTHAQLHGAESPEYCAQSPLPVIKALRVKDQSSLASLSQYQVHAFLLDSYVPGQHGGTGEKFNWDLAIQAKAFGPRILLAGGLTPENVAEAVATVRPYGVDVSSGVESSPGRKDHAKVREFIRRAKAVP